MKIPKLAKFGNWQNLEIPKLAKFQNRQNLVLNLNCEKLKFGIWPNFSLQISEILKIGKKIQKSKKPCHAMLRIIKFINEDVFYNLIFRT
jgi:hypothetical protein